MKEIEYKGYFIKPSNNRFPSSDECGICAFRNSRPIFHFKSVRAAKCFITRHLTPK